MAFFKNNNWFAPLFAVALLITGITSCVKTEFDEPPVGGGQVEDISNTTIKALKALHVVPGGFDKITEDLIIRGEVIMDDRSGNYYKTIVIQDATGGIEVKFNDGFLFNQFPVGRIIYIRCKGLQLTDYNTLTQLIGGTITEAGVQKSFGLTQDQVRLNVVKGEISATPLTPRKVTMNDVKNLDYVSTLVQFDDVQFNSLDTAGTYADAVTQNSVNRKVEDCDKKNLLLRTSGYADFAGTKLAKGKGSLVAVLGKYNNDYQLFIRNTNDVQFSGVRCGGGGPGPGGDITANTTIKALKALHTTGNFENITDDLIIKGEVVMDDQSGNYFKAIVIQDATGGIEVKIDAYDLNLSYPVGSLVGIRCKGLILSDFNGLVQLAGSTSNASGTTKSLGLTADQVAANVVAAGAATPPATPKVVKINQLTADMVSTLVRLDDVQFIQADAGKTYADAVGLLSLNRNIEDCDGLKLTLRTSGYADFAGTATPSGKGTLVGVLGIYNGTYQIAIRNTNDANMTGARCGGGPNPTGPLTSLNETFDLATDNADIALTGWYNIATAGTRNWTAKSFSGDRYAQATAFQSNLSDMQSWLITPALDLTVARTLNFTSAIAYYKHDGLTVWVSNNFNGTNPAAATWTQIDCDLAGASNANFEIVPSGPIALPIYATGTGHIAFKYSGNATTNTTTFRVDNVKMQ